MNGDDVTVLQKASPACLSHAIHQHAAALNENLGMPAGGRRTCQLQQRPQGDWACDANVLQLLSLIGMMR